MRTILAAALISATMTGCALPNKDNSMDYLRHQEAIKDVDDLNQREFSSEISKSSWRLCKGDQGKAYKAKSCAAAK